MTPDERRSLAEQISANPLFNEILADMERSAIERLIYADDEETRLTAQLRTQAIRHFRADLGAALSTRAPKSAPA